MPSRRWAPPRARSRTGQSLARLSTSSDEFCTSSVWVLYVPFMFHFASLITLFILPWEVHRGFLAWPTLEKQSMEDYWSGLDWHWLRSILIDSAHSSWTFSQQKSTVQTPIPLNGSLNSFCARSLASICHRQLRTGIDATTHHLVRPGLSLTPVIKRWNGQPLAFWKLLGHLPTHCLDNSRYTICRCSWRLGTVFALLTVPCSSCSIACNIWNTLSQYRFDDLLIYNHMHLCSIYIQSCKFMYNNLPSSGQWSPCRRTSCFHPQGASERQISAVPWADDEAGRPNMPQIISPQVPTDLHRSPRDPLYLGTNGTHRTNGSESDQRCSELLEVKLFSMLFAVHRTCHCHSVVFRNQSKGIMVQQAVATY